MQLEIEQAEISLAIEFEAQTLEIVEQRSLFGEERFRQPTRGVPTNLAASLEAALRPDSGGRKIPADASPCGALVQSKNPRRRQKAVADRQAFRQ